MLPFFIPDGPALSATLAGVLKTGNGETLNIRARPDTKAQVLGNIPNGTALLAIKEGQMANGLLKIYFEGRNVHAMSSYIALPYGIFSIPQPVIKEAMVRPNFALYAQPPMM